MSQSIDLFLPLVKEECPGITNIDARRAVVQACRDFCTRTYVWQEDHDDLTAVEDVPDYDLEPPTDAEVVDILCMYHNEFPVTPKTETQLTYENSQWRLADGGQARHFVMNSPTNFSLYPFPDETVADSICNIRVALRPVIGATTVGDLLYTDYQEAIANGARALLLAKPKKPWTNGRRAEECLNEFEFQLSRAKVRARKQYSRTDLHARKAIRRFGGP